MTVPPYEWPTRTIGPLTRPNVRIVASTSPFSVSRPYCAAITWCPSALRVGISFWKHEPSAQIPWEKTILGFITTIIQDASPLGLSIRGVFQVADRRTNRQYGDSAVERHTAVATGAWLYRAPVVMRCWEKSKRGVS